MSILILFQIHIYISILMNIYNHLNILLDQHLYEHAYGWNLPGSTSLLAECHQIISKADVLLGSFFQRNAQILLRSFNER